MTKRCGSAESRHQHQAANSRPSIQRPYGERGQATFSLLIVVAVVAVAVILLQRTAWHAEHINDKAGVIATTGGGINTATQAVLKLGRTNELAASILETAKPLEGKLAEITRLAKSVDGLAKSINGSASTVDGTAKSINGNATGIVQTAQSIDRGVKQIITNINMAIDLVTKIKGDTTNILTQAEIAHRLAACIDHGLPSPGSPADSHCK